jgi:F420H(2)-dependent quinone reductase
MTARRPFGIWVKNRVANPVLRPLLRSRAGRRLGKHLALIRYRGRRTGQSYELPVQYAQVDSTVWILPGTPQHKTWWRNLRDGADVDLMLAGNSLRGRAIAIDGGQHPDEVAKGLAAYVAALPRAGRTLGLSSSQAFDPSGADVRRVTQNIILVRVDLDEDRRPRAY